MDYGREDRKIWREDRWKGKPEFLIHVRAYKYKYIKLKNTNNHTVTKDIHKSVGELS